MRHFPDSAPGSASNGPDEHDMTETSTAKGNRVRALVYGDVDLNIIDGSAIWAQAMVQALREAGVEVTFVLKAPVRTDRLVAPLEKMPDVTVRRLPEDAALPGH